jgi:acyl carrier protein
MEEKQVIQDIVSVFKDTFPELQSQELNVEKVQDEFENWDSFSHLELVEKVEQKFGVKFEFDEIVELNSPRKFIQLVMNKGRKW